MYDFSGMSDVDLKAFIDSPSTPLLYRQAAEQELQRRQGGLVGSAIRALLGLASVLVMMIVAAVLVSGLVFGKWIIGG